MDQNLKKYIFVGSHLKNLIQAKKLKEQGHFISILEPLPEAGGLYKPWREGVDSFWERSPSTEELGALDIFDRIDSQEIQGTQFLDGKFKNFMSLEKADNPFAHDVVQLMLSEKFLQPKPSLSQMTDQLLEELESDIQNLSRVEQLVLEDDKVVAIQTADGEKLDCDELIWGGALEEALSLLPHDRLNLKSLKKVKRQPFTSILVLSFQGDFSSLNYPDNYYLQNKQKTHCLGYIEPLHSLWMCYLSGELSADHDTQAKHVREMKKLIYRAFPELRDKTEKEKIFFHPEVLPTQDIKGLSTLKNLSWSFPAFL